MLNTNTACTQTTEAGFLVTPSFTSHNLNHNNHQNLIIIGAPLLSGKAQMVGAVHPGEGKAVGRPYSSLPVLEGAYRKDGENIVSRACCDRARSNGFKLQETRSKEEIFYHEGGETLEQILQRDSGGSIPGNIPGQAGWGSEKPGLVEDVPAHCRGVGLDDL